VRSLLELMLQGSQKPFEMREETTLHIIWTQIASRKEKHSSFALKNAQLSSAGRGQALKKLRAGNPLSINRFRDGQEIHPQQGAVFGQRTIG